MGAPIWPLTTLVGRLGPYGRSQRHSGQLCIFVQAIMSRERTHMPRVARLRNAVARSPGRAGIMDGDEHVRFPPVPGDRHPAAGHRCQICDRTLAYRPGSISEVLTAHYRQPIPKHSAFPPRTSALAPATASFEDFASLGPG